MVILIFWWLQKLILAFLNFLRRFIWCLKPIWKVCVGVRIDNFFIIFSISQFLWFVLLEAILNTLKLVLEFFEHQKLCFWGFLKSVCRCVYKYFFYYFFIFQFLCFVLLEAISNTLKLVLEFFGHQKLCFWGFLASVCRCV